MLQSLTPAAVQLVKYFPLALTVTPSTLLLVIVLTLLARLMVVRGEEVGIVVHLRVYWFDLTVECPSFKPQACREQLIITVTVIDGALTSST